MSASAPALRQARSLLAVLAVVAPSGRRVAAGAAALGSAVALTAVSAWLISRAAEHPSIVVLSVAIVAVRALGISRGVFRYVERLTSHDVALRGTVTLREQLYVRLAAADRSVMAGLRHGDLVARVGPDVDLVGDVLVRGLLPFAVAVVGQRLHRGGRDRAAAARWRGADGVFGAGRGPRAVARRWRRRPVPPGRGRDGLRPLGTGAPAARPRQQLTVAGAEAVSRHTLAPELLAVLALVRSPWRTSSARCPPPRAPSCAGPSPPPRSSRCWRIPRHRADPQRAPPATRCAPSRPGRRPGSAPRVWTWAGRGAPSPYGMSISTCGRARCWSSPGPAAAGSPHCCSPSRGSCLPSAAGSGSTACLPGGLSTRLEAGTVSGGERRRLLLARAVTAELVDQARRAHVAVVMVTHDGRRRAPQTACWRWTADARTSPRTDVCAGRASAHSAIPRVSSTTVMNRS